MPTVETSRFGHLLRTVFGLKEPSGQSVLEDVFPIYPLEDATAVETYRARGNRLICANESRTNVGGLLPNSTFFGLPGPGAASGPTQPPLIACITQMAIGVSGADRVRWWIEKIDVPGPVTAASFQDTREDPVQQRAQLKTFSNESANPGVAAHGTVFLSAATVVIPVKILLVPGFRLTVGQIGVAAGLSLSVTVFGYERSVEASELV